MSDEQPKTSSRAILNPRSAGTTTIGSVPPIEPGERRSRGPGGGAGRERLALALAVLFTLGAGAYMFYALEVHAVADPLQRAGRGEVDARSDLSLARPANFERALSVIRRTAAPGATVRSLSIRPTRIDVTMVNPDGATQSGQIPLDYSLELTAFSSSDYDGLTLDAFDPDVPQAIIDAATVKPGLVAADFDYMTASASPIDPADSAWYAFWTKPPRGNDLTAALDGSDLRPLGTPDAATRKAQRRADATAAKAQHEAAKQARLAAKQAKCLAGAVDAEAVTRCLE